MSPDPAPGATARSTLRVGLVHAEPLERWEADCLEELLAVPGVEPVLRICPPPRRRADRAGSSLFRLWWRRQRPRMREPAELPAGLASAPSLTYNPLADTGGAPESVLTQIRNYRVDLLLDLTSAMPDPAFRELARHGVCFFQHGARPGWPPCFAEVYEGARVVRSSFRRLSASGDGVLREAVLPTRPHSYSRTVDTTLSASTRWPAQVGRELLEGAWLPRSPAPGPTGAGAIPLPGTIAMVRFLARQAAWVIAWLGQVVFRHGDWNVGVVRAPIASFLEGTQPGPVEWLPGPPRGEFIADPFGVWHQGRTTVLCERYPYRTGLGEIAAVTLDSSRTAAVEIGPAVHRSYPYLLEYRGEVFCVPETHQAREVALYRALEFPVRWEKVATLIRDVAALDSTLIEFGGRWWMWYVDAERGAQSELYLWHAADLRGAWSPHPGNPVKIDVRSARPGGTPFVHDGTLYRPAQDCSVTYGGRVVLNRVTCLTHTAYAEEAVTVVLPDPAGPYPDGLHTLSACGELTLVDGKRIVFEPRESYRALKQLVGWAVGGRARD